MTTDLLAMDAPALRLLDASAGQLDSLRCSLQIEHPGLLVRTIRGSRSRTVPAFFDEVAAACQFPSYFGGNWMAFDECTDELGGETGAGCALLISAASQLLADEAETELETAVQTWVATAERWRTSSEAPRLFCVILQDHSYPLSLVQARLEKLGQSYSRVLSPLQ
jgi:Barstar (barnase inhibitor)